MSSNLPPIPEILNTPLVRQPNNTIGSLLASVLIDKVRSGALDMVLMELDTTFVSNGWVQGEFIQEDGFSYVDGECPGEIQELTVKIIQTAFTGSQI